MCIRQARLEPLALSASSRERYPTRCAANTSRPRSDRFWAWFKSGLQLKGGWDRRPKGNAPDPRPPRWGLAGCCQLDPSQPTIVTCEAGKEGRHAPRPNDVGGQPRFPGARQGVPLPLLVISGLATGPPAGVGDGLRFLSTARQYFCPRLGRFACGNSAISQQISTFYGPSVQAMETRLGRQRRRPRRFTAVVPTPHAYSGQWPLKTKRARARRLRLGCHPETPVIEPCPSLAAWTPRFSDFSRQVAAPNFQAMDT